MGGDNRIAATRLSERETRAAGLHPHLGAVSPHAPALVRQWDVVRRRRALELSYGPGRRAANAHTRRCVSERMKGAARTPERSGVPNEALDNRAAATRSRESRLCGPDRT